MSLGRPSGLPVTPYRRALCESTAPRDAPRREHSPRCHVRRPPRRRTSGRTSGRMTRAAPRPRATLILASLWRRCTLSDLEEGHRTSEAIKRHLRREVASRRASSGSRGLSPAGRTAIRTGDDHRHRSASRRRCGRSSSASSSSGSRRPKEPRRGHARKGFHAGPGRGGSSAAASRSAPVAPVLAACESAAPLASAAAEAAAAAVHAAR